MLFTVFLLFTATGYAAVPKLDSAEDFKLDKLYPRFFELPDGDGNMHLVDLEEKPNTELLNKFTRESSNQYLLFTRRNHFVGQNLLINNTDSITNSNFNPNNPIIVIAHGWLSTSNTEPNPTLRDAFLLRNDVNVISLDWREVALKQYTTAVAGVPLVGQALGEFLMFLHDATGASYSNMHLTGFSLGAHVVGNAGRTMEGRVARVTGLDPGGPMWSSNPNRLQPTDGIYVEAIHTDGGALGQGIGIPVAKVDFYPNGGQSQPGCFTTVCRHSRSWQFFASSVTYDHLKGNQCANTLEVTLNRCRGSILHMGNDDLTKYGTGIYRVNTRWRYPY